MSMKLLGIISVGSVVIDLQPIRFSTLGRYWRKNGSIIGWCICYLLTSGKPMTQFTEKFFTVLGDSINTIKENSRTLLESSRDVGLEINAEDKVYDYVSSSELRTEPEYKDS
jgi:hypothetical protein